MLIDMHTHSSGASHCAKKDARSMVDDAIAVGLDGFILCNHYTKKYVEAMGIPKFNDLFTNEFHVAKEYADPLGFRVFFGIEVTMEFCRDVHMLIYGVDDEFHKRHEKLYDMTQKELYETVKSEGGILVQGHPLRGGNNVLLDPAYLDAVELNNHIKYDGPQTEYLCDFAHENGIFVTSGGDYHADTRRTFCGVYLPDDITDCRGIKDFLVGSESYDLQIEDEPSRITFTKR